MSITILLADDHTILRDGLRSILESEQDMQIIGEASNGHEAIDRAHELCPDIVVMDIGMPDLNGVEATLRILAQDSKMKIIALSAYADKQFVLAMLEAGAMGYVIKSNASSELIRAIRAVASNQKYLSPSIASFVVDGFLGKHFVNDASAQAILGGREREVLQLIAEGKTSKEISAFMHIAESTVETHRRNIMNKLDLHTISELTKYAIREGLTQA